MAKPRIAFYAPIKPPDHPIASGDREIARLLVRALRACGYDVEIASRYIAYQKRPSQALFDERKSGALIEAQAVVDRYRSDQPPDLWFTYHPYCKAADWIGPAVCEAFAIPYVTAEAARTRQGEEADWVNARAQVQKAASAAAVNFCLKQSDWAYLQTFLRDMNNVVRIKPFIDVSETIANARDHPYQLPFANAGPVIVTAGMMRPGWKLESYKLLASALAGLTDRAWNLLIIGDGPAIPDVKAAFSFVPPERSHFAGSVHKGAVPGMLASADIFAWPGMHEAIGMVFMEAQAVGLPVAAMASLGVPLVVDDGVTGILAAEGDASGLRVALTKLLAQPSLRAAFGAAAVQHVRNRHDIAAASRTLKSAIDPLLGNQ